KHLAPGGQAAEVVLVLRHPHVEEVEVEVVSPPAGGAIAVAPRVPPGLWAAVPQVREEVDGEPDSATPLSDDLCGQPGLAQHSGGFLPDAGPAGFITVAEGAEADQVGPTPPAPQLDVQVVEIPEGDDLKVPPHMVIDYHQPRLRRRRGGESQR